MRKDVITLQNLSKTVLSENVSGKVFQRKIFILFNGKKRGPNHCEKSRTHFWKSREIRLNAPFF